MDLNKLIPKFKTFLAKDGKSESTVIGYITDLKQLSKFLENKEVSKITKKDLNNFLKFINKERNLTNKTASRKINSFNTFFRYVLKRKILSKNPAERIKHPDLEPTLPQIIDPIEYKAIRDTARPNFRVFAMIETLLQTGIKIGELSRLKVDDVKLNSIPPQFIIREYESSPMRTVDISPKLQETLEKYLKQRINYPKDQGYLFNTRSGKCVQVRNIRTAIDRICANAGLERVKVNDFRNTFITHQIENGVKLKKIAETVGHRRPSTTEKYLTVTEVKKPGSGDEIIPL